MVPRNEALNWTSSGPAAGVEGDAGTAAGAAGAAGGEGGDGGDGTGVGVGAGDGPAYAEAMGPTAAITESMSRLGRSVLMSFCG